MITGIINSKVNNSKEGFEGAKFSVDVFNDNSKVKIQIGSQEVLIDKAMFLKASDIVRDAKLSNRKLPINIIDGKLTDK